jgi:large subunit ribosomal protein L4
LVVLPQHDHNIYLSARNLQRNKVVTAGELNTYDVLNAQHLVLVEGSVPALETRFLS